jgi:hypothetical protein
MEFCVEGWSHVLRRHLLLGFGAALLAAPVLAQEEEPQWFAVGKAELQGHMGITAFDIGPELGTHGLMRLRTSGGPLALRTIRIFYTDGLIFELAAWLWLGRNRVSPGFEVRPTGIERLVVEFAKFPKGHGARYLLLEGVPQTQIPEPERSTT